MYTLPSAQTIKKYHTDNLACVTPFASNPVYVTDMHFENHAVVFQTFGSIKHTVTTFIDFHSFPLQSEKSKSNYFNETFQLKSALKRHNYTKNTRTSTKIYLDLMFTVMDRLHTCTKFQEN